LTAKHLHYFHDYKITDTIRTKW